MEQEDPKKPHPEHPDNPATEDDDVPKGPPIETNAPPGGDPPDDDPPKDPPPVEG